MRRFFTSNAETNEKSAEGEEKKDGIGEGNEPQANGGFAEDGKLEADFKTERLAKETLLK